MNTKMRRLVHSASNSQSDAMILKLEGKPGAALTEALQKDSWGLLKVQTCAEYPLLGIFPKEIIRKVGKMLNLSEE